MEKPTLMESYLLRVHQAKKEIAKKEQSKTDVRRAAEVITRLQDIFNRMINKEPIKKE